MKEVTLKLYSFSELQDINPEVFHSKVKEHEG